MLKKGISYIKSKDFKIKVGLIVMLLIFIITLLSAGSHAFTWEWDENQPFVKKIGDTMTGNLNMTGNKLTNVSELNTTWLTALSINTTGVITSGVDFCIDGGSCLTTIDTDTNTWYVYGDDYYNLTNGDFINKSNFIGANITGDINMTGNKITNVSELNSSFISTVNAEIKGSIIADARDWGTNKFIDTSARTGGGADDYIIYDDALNYWRGDGVLASTYLSANAYINFAQYIRSATGINFDMRSFLTGAGNYGYAIRHDVNSADYDEHHSLWFWRDNTDTDHLLMALQNDRLNLSVNLNMTEKNVSNVNVLSASSINSTGVITSGIDVCIDGGSCLSSAGGGEVTGLTDYLNKSKGGEVTQATNFTNGLNVSTYLYAPNITSNVNLDDSAGDSPVLTFTDGSDEYTTIFKDQDAGFYTRLYGDNGNPFVLELYDEDAVGSTNDFGSLWFGLEDDSGTIFHGSKIRWTITDASDGAEDMDLGFYTTNDGVEELRIWMEAEGDINFTGHNLTNVSELNTTWLSALSINTTGVITSGVDFCIDGGSCLSSVSVYDYNEDWVNESNFRGANITGDINMTGNKITNVSELNTTWLSALSINTTGVITSAIDVCLADGTCLSTAGADTWYVYGDDYLNKSKGGEVTQATNFTGGLNATKYLYAPNVTSIFNMSGNNVTNIGHLFGNGGAVSIGHGTSAYGAVADENDLYVQDSVNIGNQLLVNGYIYLTAGFMNLYDNIRITFGNSNDWSLRWATTQASAHTALIALGTTSRSIIFTSVTYDTKDYDHPAQDDPTIFLQGNENPDTDNQEWMSLRYSHSSEKGIIDTGKGDIMFNKSINMSDGNIRYNITDAWTITASNYSGASPAKWLTDINMTGNSIYNVSQINTTWLQTQSANITGWLTTTQTTVTGNLGLNRQLMTCADGDPCDEEAINGVVQDSCPAGYELAGSPSHACVDADLFQECASSHVDMDTATARCTDGIGNPCTITEVNFICDRMTDIGDS